MTPTLRRPSRLPGGRRPGRTGAVVAALLALLLPATACSSSLGWDDIGDPTPVADGGVAPAGRTDPAAQPALARFYGQRVAWTDCDGGFQCAKVTVPVDWAHPDAATLQLAVLRRPATGQRLGSLLINPGGPGVGGASWVREAAGTFGGALRSSYDLVGWDPRGTGDSAPVHCLDDSQLGAYYAGDMTPDNGAEVQQFVESQRAFARACQAHTGTILAHVDTVSTARDMDVLRAALGDRVLTYYGASYGTYLGAWYAQEFPWRVGRMVLDGAVDPSLTSEQYAQGQALGFTRAVRAYLKDCLSQDGCPFRGTVDDAMSQLQGLLARADTAPLPTSGGRQLTQSLMATGLAQGMYAQALWPTVTQGITQAMRGDGSQLLALSDQYTDRDSHGRYGEDLTAYSPIYCLDHAPSGTVDQVLARARVFGASYPPLGDFIATGDVQCVVWPLRAVVPAQRLTARGAAPIVVIGTTDDPATPYEWAKSLASQLSSARLLTRTGQGHAAYRQGNPCIDRAVDRYLVQGTLPAAAQVCP
ncbi:MAG TPA: alpha/beta hydrolase [Kineosporiaceae bacterium]|nr:alpha/beta hydrolase [Kineosporiaceae bacterium]